MNDPEPGPADAVVAEQVAYYRARAPWYDDWWEARDRYATTEAERAAWMAERAVLEGDLDAWAFDRSGAHVLELAAGTGNLTVHLARHAARITAVDAAPEVLERNAAKLGPHAARVEWVVADLFTWVPDRTYDAVVFGFWVSHVPPGRWERFWSTVRDALVPGRGVWFCDNASPQRARRDDRSSDPGSESAGLGDGTVDHGAGVHERSLPDGRRFRLVKRFHDPSALAADLERRGFAARVWTTDWAFLLGRATVASA